MKRSLIVIACLSLVLLGNLSAKPIDRLKGGDEIDFLKNSTLMVVLLEENPKYVDKLTKSHKAVLLAAYRNNIKMINDNLKATAAKYLTMSKAVDYKTMTEIVDLPEATREGYSYLVYDRATQFSADGVSNFEYDFYIDKDAERKAMLDDYLAFIQFDCADPKYHGEDDYRKMAIIVEGRKRANEAIFVQSLDMIIPTEASLTLCFIGLQRQYDEAVTPPKKMTKDEIKQGVRNDVAKARTKELLICKDYLEKNVTEAKIAAGFKYKFKLVTRAEFDKAILDKDPASCLLVVYPADKTDGGYRPVVNYEHRIVDAETDDVLVTVVPDPNAAGMPPSYQKINDKQFKDIVKTEDDITK